ncbi:hypothetical protein ATANTOWER_023029 [Ataeniobius toweri]|uniref:Uncharacterized protein n=1 Tax=Ataeniobius toweri TaxID=208326 RepID=A0ABU7C3F7_9TELE|nr:hypothetical protein [Ataeniobius toweri]
MCFVEYRMKKPRDFTEVYLFQKSDKWITGHCAGGESCVQCRRDIVVHTRKLVSAVSGLTMVVNVLATVGRSFNGSGPSAELSVNEEVGESTGGHQQIAKPQLKKLF